MNKRNEYVTKWFFLLICVSVLINCTKPKENKEENLITKKEHLPDKNEVNILFLEKGVFKKELISNVSLVALEKSELKFKVS